MATAHARLSPVHSTISRIGRDGSRTFTQYWVMSTGRDGRLGSTFGLLVGIKALKNGVLQMTKAPLNGNKISYSLNVSKKQENGRVFRREWFEKKRRQKDVGRLELERRDGQNQEWEAGTDKYKVSLYYT